MAVTFMLPMPVALDADLADDAVPSDEDTPVSLSMTVCMNVVLLVGLGHAQELLHLHPQEALHDCEGTLIDDDAFNTRAPARLPTHPREARARPALPTPTPTPAPLPRQVALGGRGSTPPSARSSSPCPCCSRLLARRSLWTRTCRRRSSARARGSAAATAATWACGG